MRLPGINGGIAGGAEYVVLPEFESDPEEIATILSEAYEKGKAHAIIVVAEGAKYNANALDAYFKEHRERLGFDLRVTILGHTQRGGSPSAHTTGFLPADLGQQLLNNLIMVIMVCWLARSKVKL